MNVGVLLITHGDIGNVLLQTAIDVLSVCPLSTCVLVLTDLYGSTPSNIACRLHRLSNVRVVSGINLPMLIRVLNYPDLDLDELAHKALTGGRDGVLTCSIEGAPHEG